jgi:hypothetical protein
MVCKPHLGLGRESAAPGHPGSPGPAELLDLFDIPELALQLGLLPLGNPVEFLLAASAELPS